MTSVELKKKLDDSIERVNKRWNTLEKQSKKVGVDFNKLKDVILNSTLLDKEVVLYKDIRELLKDFNLDFDDWDVDTLVESVNKLFDLLKIQKNWENKYNKQVNIEDKPKIQVIVDFLNNWEDEVREFFIENSKEYFELRQKESEEYQKFKAEHPRDRYTSSWNSFIRDYYKDIHSITKEITLNSREWKIDEDRLNKILEREKQNKYEILEKRVKDICGEIQDASNLYIGKNGELNGFIIGDKGKAKVETIGAGGYNIQCFHYRLLVNPVK